MFSSNTDNRCLDSGLIGGAVLLLTALGIYALLSHASTLSFTVQQSLAKFTEKGVSVEVVVEKDQTGQTWLASTFTPTQPRFHLYSKDLPRTGISGVGTRAGAHVRSRLVENLSKIARCLRCAFAPKLEA